MANACTGTPGPSRAMTPRSLNDAVTGRDVGTQEKRRMRYILAALVALAAGHASAQDGGWSFKITPYVWLPDTTIGVDTPRGTVSAELGIDDAIKDLDFAFMGAFEANRGKWSLVTDLLYFNITASEPTPFGGLFSQAAVGSKTTALSGLVAYRVHEDETFALDVGGGLRAWWLESTVTLTGLLPTERYKSSDNWVDPFIAVRAHMNFNEKWFGTLYLDGGGFGVGSDQTYQAIVSAGYNVNDKWSLVGGWRYIDFNRVKNGSKLDLKQSGVILGASYRF
jgi:opacity protein-like surface antigen